MFRIILSAGEHEKRSLQGTMVEFYKTVWPTLRNLLADSLNAVVNMVKKDKNRVQIENWGPILLQNVNYKIGSKTLAARTEKVLTLKDEMEYFTLSNSRLNDNFWF